MPIPQNQIHDESRAPRYAVVFTAYGWDDFHEAQYRRHAARTRGGDMHVVVDESRGVVAVPSAYRKVSASKPAAAALGLRLAYLRTLFWHNLDYLYYVFYDRHPDYDYYIFLDYDAVVDRDYDDLVAEVERGGIDLVGQPIGDRIEDWTFFDAHSGVYDPAKMKAWISAVTVISNRALAHLYERRRRDSAQPSAQQRAFWPFCEAFVPTELAAAGFALAELRTFGDVARFAWWPPTLAETLAPTGKGGFVHPVLDRPRFIASMLKHSRTHEFVTPWSRLWRAILTCPDRRWIAPFLAEAAYRVRRVLSPFADRGETEAVGMRPFRRDPDEAKYGAKRPGRQSLPRAIESKA